MLWLSILPPASSAATLSWPELACRLGRYTPRLSLVSGGSVSAPRVEAIQLEISGSVRLFGGLPRLLAAVKADLAELVDAAAIAVATSPLAALWLARGGSAAVCVDRAATRAALVVLPLAALYLPPEVALRLNGFGLRSLGQVLSLPRAALGVRLGQAFLLDLARALGEVDHPQAWFEFPERFEQALELPAPVESAPILLFAARRLLGALSGWLEARNASVRELSFLMAHGEGAERVPDTELRVRFSAAVHAAERIERVLKESLERCTLTAPVLSLRLIVDRSEVRDARSAVLFDGAAAGGEALAELLDRLGARLGVEAVTGLTCHPDHRPEWASRASHVSPDGPAHGTAGPRRGHGLRTSGVPHGCQSSAPAATVAPSWPSRPLWLFDPPQPLPEHDGRPYYNGPLTLLGGPERIESGWWDNHDARRDYFVAIDSKASWLWVFRDPRPRQRVQPGHGGWFVHGVFS